MAVDFTLPRCGTMIVHLFYNTKDCILNRYRIGFANKKHSYLSKDSCFNINGLKTICNLLCNLKK